MGNRSSAAREEYEQACVYRRGDPTVQPDPGSDECAICWRDDVRGTAMPCCAPTQGSRGMLYCKRCLHLICLTDTRNQFGKCPTSRKLFALVPCDGEDSGMRLDFDVAVPRGRCDLCRQITSLPDPPYCAQCRLGRQHQFRYECQRCRRWQTIPHPMWKYQAHGPAEFGNTTWACHRGCDDYTFWRVHPEDAWQIPDAECPGSWGRREQWLAVIREQSLRQ
mmetsp:Transcript_22173/g.55909  ORF Transcript_22173/g.55909 Transcript_22173/m.55909 type:complete len:221 (-) Transcript_22173:498-1160(-)|eukprot:g10895.t1